MLSSFSELINREYLGILKPVRAIKLLEISKYWLKLKIILISLSKSTFVIINQLLFILIIFWIIALIPLKYLKGKFYHCTNVHEEILEE